MRKKFTHLIMKFKINDAVSFVHAHLSQISFSNFLNRRLVQFSCIYFASGLLTLTDASEAFKKGYSEVCLNIEQDCNFT